ncbi:MAG: hypothetical protein ABWX76_15690 [Leifsonia flava]
MRRVRRTRITGGCTAVALVLALGTFGTTVATAQPGSPGTMEPPRLIQYEGFENAPPATDQFVQTLADYPNDGPITVPGYVGATGETYGADPQWNGQYCNGLIVSAVDSDDVPAAPQSTDCSAGGWHSSRSLAHTLGLWAENSDYPYSELPSRDALSNHAVTAYTEGDSPAGMMLETEIRPALVQAGHYYSASIDLAQANCWTTNPVALAIALSSGGTSIDVFPGPVDVCDLPVHQLNGDNVGTFVGIASILTTGSDLELAIRNDLGGGGGDDNAYDNIAVLDTTPKLDLILAQGPDDGDYAVGSSARVALTVTNTHLAGFPLLPSGPKHGWSFSVTLPDGLVVADDPRAETDCPVGTISGRGGEITGTGDLTAITASCDLSIDVTSTRAGSYVLSSASVDRVGLLAPADAAVTFVGPAVTPSPTPTNTVPTATPSGAPTDDENSTTDASSMLPPMGAPWSPTIIIAVGLIAAGWALLRRPLSGHGRRQE